jgi:hypothetical protein
VSVIATSNYFAYLIGRKQVTYETLRRQVDLVVQFMDQKRVEEALAPAALKQRQDRLEQNAPALTGLTTSTINGKTTVVAPERAMPAAPIDDNNEARAQAPDSSLNAVTKGVAQRGPRRQKASPAAPKRGPAEAAIAEQAAAAPDAGVAGQ